MGHYIAYLPTAKPSVTTSKNSIEFTYGDFPCHLKVKRVKSALIYWLQRCKQGERWTITANSFTKIDRFGGFRPLWRRSRWGNPAAPGTNQIAGFVEFRPLTISKKSIYIYTPYKLSIIFWLKFLHVSCKQHSFIEHLVLSTGLIIWIGHSKELAFEFLYGGQFTLVTQLIILYYLAMIPNDAAPQFL